MPKLSIIIPVHNVEAYLRRCVDSVLAQTLTDTEVILVENCSTDSSPAICREYVAKDPRVKMITLTEAGLSLARNEGVKVATAPWVGFVDSDDWIDPDMYQTMLEAMELHGAKMAYCNYCTEWSDGHTEHPYPDTGRIEVLSAREVQQGILMDRITCAACVRIFPREFFKSHEFPRGKYYEDHSTTYRWTAQFPEIVWVDRPFYHYFMNVAGICRSTRGNKQKTLDFFEAQFGRLAYMDENQLFDGNELVSARNHILHMSLIYFKRFMRELGKDPSNPELMAVREQLRTVLRYRRGEISWKYWRDVRYIFYAWPLYYKAHYHK